MIEIWQPNTNIKYANSSMNYYVITIVQNLEKNQLQNRQFPIFFAYPSRKYRVEANNNRKAVVICARHVVKRPSKRSALVLYNYGECLFV